ncbi:MAG: HAD family phosphatase [Dactylosporangium sp.]|nr:Cof-type HAD-IIB family hydrolase [Dactylosporangium sp.]NNJ60458.1 HAD family phosphatase [Dactylosporangium sp.]
MIPAADRTVPRPRLRLVASDLDGTLLREDETLSHRTARALSELAGRGVHIVLATGRPQRTLAPVYRQLPIRPWTVCANGAAVYDPDTDTFPHTSSLTPDLLAAACARIRAEVSAAVFAVELDGGRSMRHEPGFPLHRQDLTRSAAGEVSPEELTGRPAAKLIVKLRDTASTADAKLTRRLATAVTQALGAAAEATYSGDFGMVEISAPGVTKATGLSWIADRLGISPDETLVFGDMPNDLPMFAWSSHRVAVRGAHPEVLAAATAVTGGNDDDGVAAYLETLDIRLGCDIRRSTPTAPAPGATIGA